MVRIVAVLVGCSVPDIIKVPFGEKLSFASPHLPEQCWRKITAAGATLIGGWMGGAE